MPHLPRSGNAYISLEVIVQLVFRFVQFLFFNSRLRLIFKGYDTKTRLKSVEKLDLSDENPQWQSVSPLLFRRALPAVCVQDSQFSNRFKNSCFPLLTYLKSSLFIPGIKVRMPFQHSTLIHGINRSKRTLNTPLKSKKCY